MQLPDLVHIISDRLPQTNAVEIIRLLFMDQWPAAPWRHGLVLVLVLVLVPVLVLVLVAYTVGAFWVALALTRKRFRA